MDIQVRSKLYIPNGFMRWTTYNKYEIEVKNDKWNNDNKT